MIGVAFPLATLIALTGGYWLSGRALNPVRELALAAGSMSINCLDKCVPVTNPHDEIRQLATTLNSLISRLETAVTEIRRFTADASHEIRTPLAAIRMEAELALSRIRSDNEYRLALSVVVEKVTRLGRLADQLLDLSRHDAGLRQKCTARINVSHVLHETVEKLTGISKSKGVKLTLDCEGIPVALGDEIRLRQAFCNVLENAIKYTAPGGSVSVCCKVQQKQIRIEFRDTGIGICPEHIPRLFERFYRVDESRSQNTGARVWDCQLPEPTCSHASEKFPLPANRASAPLSLCCSRYWMSVNLKPNSHSMEAWRRLVFEISLRRSGIFTQNGVESRKADRRTCPLTPDSGRSTMKSGLQDPPALTVSRGNPEQAKEWSNGFPNRTDTPQKSRRFYVD
jgi:hypothetical protein